MSGKTNVFLSLISTILITVGATSIAANPTSAWFGVIITICGAVGLGIREWLKPKANPPSQ